MKFNEELLEAENDLLLQCHWISTLYQVTQKWIIKSTRSNQNSLSSTFYWVMITFRFVLLYCFNEKYLMQFSLRWLRIFELPAKLSQNFILYGKWSKLKKSCSFCCERNQRIQAHLMRQLHIVVPGVFTRWIYLDIWLTAQPNITKLHIVLDKVMLI